MAATETAWRGLIEGPASTTDTDFFFFDDLANTNFDIELGYPGSYPINEPSLPQAKPVAKAQPAEGEASPSLLGKRQAPEALPTPLAKRQRRTRAATGAIVLPAPILDAVEDDEDDLDVEEKKLAIRKARNRKAAKDFRMRKKRKAQELEEQNKALAETKERLAMSEKVLAKENEALKEQLQYLRKFVTNMMHAALPAMNGAFAPQGEFPLKPTKSTAAKLREAFPLEEFRTAMGLEAEKPSEKPSE